MRARLFVLFFVGLGACRRPQPPTPHEHATVYAAAREPSTPSSWTVPNWYIDPAGSAQGPLLDGGTGPCASDSNTCTSATCGALGSGIGPCSSWREIEARLGCTGSPAGCPRWRQSTTITFLSSDVATDTMILRPSMESGATILVTGQPSTTCTGTLSGVVSKNRPSGQLLEGTLCGAAAQDAFVLDTTRGSAAWTYSLVSGSLWKLSQPLPAMQTWSCVDPAEDDGWTNGDAFTVETFPSIYLQEFSPSVADAAATGCSYGFVSNVTVAQPPGQLSALRLGGNAALVDARVVRPELWLDQVALGAGPPTVINSDIANPFSVASVSVYTTITIKGGIIRETFDGAYGGVLEGGVILTSPSTFLAVSGQLNDVFVDTGSTLETSGQAIAFHYPGQSLPFIWGPGTLNVLAPSQLTISASTGAPTLLVSTLQLNGRTVACTALNSVDAGVTCGRTLSAANLDLPVVDGGFGGAAWSPVGASLTTLSSPF